MLGTTDYCETKLKLSRLAGENENALTIKTRHFVAGKSSVQTTHLFTPARLFTAGFARAQLTYQTQVSQILKLTTGRSDKGCIHVVVRKKRAIPFQIDFKINEFYPSFFSVSMQD